MSPPASAILPRENKKAGRTGNCPKKAADSLAELTSLLSFLSSNKGRRLKEFRASKTIH